MKNTFVIPLGGMKPRDALSSELKLLMKRSMKVIEGRLLIDRIVKRLL